MPAQNEILDPQIGNARAFELIFFMSGPAILQLSFIYPKIAEKGLNISP